MARDAAEVADLDRVNDRAWEYRMIEEQPLPIRARIADRLHTHDRPVGNEGNVLRSIFGA